LSTDEKYSHRLRMLRKKHTNRASKYSLEGATDLTHFGKNIGDMSKYELKQAYVGDGDEPDEQPFSYDTLIAKSKEHRAEARRQKMEAEAELDDLNSSFKTLQRSIELRDVYADKVRNSIPDDDDDLAAIARSFQMENVVKAPAGDRKVTTAEIDDQRNQLVRKSREARDQAARDTEYNEDEELVSGDDEEFEEDYTDHMETPVMTPSHEGPSSLFSMIDSILESASSMDIISVRKNELLELAKRTPSDALNEYFKTKLFDLPIESRSLVLMKIGSIIFPLDFPRHCIVVPIVKTLESLAVTGHMSVFILLFEYLHRGGRFSPSLFQLGGRLYRETGDAAEREVIIKLVGEYCSHFTRESLDGVLRSLFPELLEMVDSSSSEFFTPLQLHHFKPVEVLCLEPAYHEDGEQWNGDHKEMRAAKRMEQKFKEEKRLTAKEMRREASATESFHAVQKKKQRETLDVERKRNIAKMNEAEANYRFTQTDNGKEPTLKMKRNKKSRLGGNNQK
jgi:hypothetical protein